MPSSVSNPVLRTLSRILREHGETFVESDAALYGSIPDLASRACSSKSWAQGQVLAYFKAQDHFVICKQVAPASCEMMVISHNGFHDVFSAHRMGEGEFIEALESCVDGRRQGVQAS